MKNKKGEILHQVMIHIILVAAILGIFLMSSAGRTDSKQVRQQVLEKQIALFIDAAEPGMNFSLPVLGGHGRISDFKIHSGRVFISANGLLMGEGYGFYTPHDVSLEFIEGNEEINDFYRVVVK